MKLPYHGLTRLSNLGRLVRAEPSMVIGRGASTILVS